MNENILEVNNLSVLIKDRFLVKNVTFSLKKGESLAIIGADKSGKTTLIKAIDGAMPISQGSIFVDGKNIKENREILTQVGICLDPPMFFKFQSVYGNLKYLTSLSNNFDKTKVDTILKSFNLLEKKNTKVLFLSYYEKKLLSLALAFLTKPKLLLLDQPFKSLPEQQATQLKKLIKKLQMQGTSVIVTSTKFEEIETECDHYIMMSDKRVSKILTPEDIEKLQNLKTYAFIQVKYPHYIGRMLMDGYSIDVKILGKRVLFEGDEELTAEVVKNLTLKRIAVYKAGFLNKKTEQIFANLAPFYRKGEEEQ